MRGSEGGLLPPDWPMLEIGPLSGASFVAPWDTNEYWIPINGYCLLGMASLQRGLNLY